MGRHLRIRKKLVRWEEWSDCQGFGNGVEILRADSLSDGGWSLYTAIGDKEWSVDTRLYLPRVFLVYVHVKLLVFTVTRYSDLQLSSIVMKCL